MRFPPAFIVRLRTHFTLHELIGRRMPLKKHGRDWLGLCPFHAEKTPSFHAYDDHYHCFGCGAHGDAIEFVRKFERLSYPDAIEALAREAGLALPEMTREETRRAEVAKTLGDALEAACQWFEKQLCGPGGELARDYAERRGLTPETLRTFRVGYAPDDRAGLHRHLKEAGFSPQLQAQAGLIVLPEEGAAYDRFRARLIFPIRNSSGRIIAFGGRLLTAAKNLPKYLNSPETDVFRKSEVLYNLDLAKKATRDAGMVVVMEGYMDVVSTAQSGIGYAVATLGTAVSAEHLRLLWQLAPEPVMCLDGDAAGLRAMQRTAEVALPLLKPGFSLRFATLPKGEDPDSYIQKHGKLAFEQVMLASKRLSQVLWESVTAGVSLESPEARAAAEDALNQMANKIAQPTLRQHYQSYFRKQLWPTKTPNGQRPEQPRSAAVESMAREELAALGQLTQHMLVTLLRFPRLLDRSDVEETLHRLEIPHGRLNEMRLALLMAAHHVDLNDADAFLTYLSQQVSEGLLDSFTGGKTMMAADADADAQGLYIWQESVFAYKRTLLELEVAEQQGRFARSMSEEDFLRLKELKDELHRAQAGHTFAPAESPIPA